MTAHPIVDAWVVAALTPLAAVALTAALFAGGYVVALWCGLARQRAADADLADLGE